MSKFMNYVKKFLTLSFMSTVAAFGLSFNNVFSISKDPKRAQVSSQEPLFSLAGSAGDSLVDASRKPRRTSDRKHWSVPNGDGDGRLRVNGTNGLAGEPKVLFGAMSSYADSQVDESQKSDEDSGEDRKREPSRRSHSRRRHRINGPTETDIQTAMISVGSLFDETPYGQTLDYKETPGNIYVYDNGKKTAIWTGNEDSNATDIYVPERTDDYDVVGAVFGRTPSNIKSITLNTNKFSSLEGPLPRPNIVIENASNWPMLQKIRVVFNNTMEESGDLDSDNKMKSFLIGSVGLILGSSDLSELLEKNSDNVHASWYYCEDSDKGLASFTGESNLLSANDSGDIDQDGVECTLENGGYTLTSIPNREKVIVPAVGVGSGGILWKLKSVNLPNYIETDKIKQIKITNIQDEDQKEKLIKYAKLSLPGLENGLNDHWDWELEDNFESDRSLTFNCIHRNIVSIIINTLTDISDWAKLNKDISLSDEEKSRQLKDIIRTNFDKASEDGKKVCNLLLDLYDLLKSNDMINLDSLKNIGGLETSASDVFGSSSEHSNYTSHVEIINRVLNAFGDAIDLFDKDEFSAMTNEEKKEEYEKILDANFSGGSEQTQRVRTLLGRFIDKLFNSEFVESLRSVSKFYGVLKDIYTRIQESAGQSVSDEEILDEAIEIFNKRFGENSAEGQILKNIMTNLVDSGALATWRETVRDWKNNLNSLNSTSDSAQTTDDLSRPEDANSLSTSSSSNSDNASTSSSSNSNSLSSSSSGTTGTNNAVGETTKESSKLAEVYNEFNNWLNNGGNKKTEKEQYTYLKNLLEKGMSSFSDDEKQEAKKMIAMIDDALTAANQQSTATTGTSTSSGTSSTSTTKTTSSASTKTSDSSVSPELLSLILSGSLAGIGISLKKRHE